MKRILYLVLFLLLLIVVPNVNANLTDGIVSYYGFDEMSGSSTFDSLKLYNGTITGASFDNTTKLLGNSSFDVGSTSNNYYTQIDEDALSFITNTHSEFTISTWVYSTTDGVWQSIWGAGILAGDAHAFNVKKRGDNNFIRARLFGSSATGIEITTNTTIPTNEWHHIVFVGFGNGTAHIYQNGILTGGTSVTSQSAGAFQRYVIGNRGRTASTAFGGLIDEYGVWNRSLNSTEISSLYNNGEGIFYPFITEPEPTLKDVTFEARDNVTNDRIGALLSINGVGQGTITSISTITINNMNYSNLFNFTFTNTSTSYTTSEYFNVNISNISLFTGYLDPVNVSEPEPEPVNLTNISFSAINSLNESIVGFSVSVNDDEYFGSTSTDILVLELPEDTINNTLYKVVYSKFGYYTSSYDDINLSSLSHEGTLVERSYIGDESLDDKAIIWILLAITGGIGASSIFARPMLVVFGFWLLFMTYFLSNNIMVSYYWFAPFGYVLGAIVILTGMLRLGFGEKF